MKTKLVVFDIAGTTVKDDGNVRDTFVYAMKQKGFDIPRDEVHRVMGYKKIYAIKMLLDEFYPDHGQDEQKLIDEIHRLFVDRMVNYYKTTPTLQPQPQAEEIFSWLRQKGVKVALNTGFTKEITDTILDRLDWEGHVDSVISSDEVEAGRPQPYMIRELMNRLSVGDASKVVKVGDTEVDVEEGRNAGCGKVVSITTGAYSRKELEQYHPDFIIDSLGTLKTIID